MATPRLWSLLRFSGERKTFEQSDAHIKRSGDTGLHIHIDFTDKNANPGRPSTSIDIESELQKTFDLVIPVVERWKAFDIVIPGNEHVDVVLKHLYECKAAPRLEAIAMSICDVEDYKVDIEFETHKNPPKPLFSGRTPSLVDVSIVDVPLRWKVNQTVFKGLVNLKLEGHIFENRLSYKQWDCLLTDSPDLRKLQILYSGPGEVEHYIPRNNTILLPTLEELYLGYLEPDEAIKTICHLCTPNLRTLKLELDEDNFDYQAFLHETLLKPLLGVSPLAHLIVLILGGLTVACEDVEMLYCSLPMLEELRLNLFYLESHFLTTVNLVPTRDRSGGVNTENLEVRGRPLVLPRLERLFLTGVNDSDLISSLRTVLAERQSLHKAHPTLTSAIQKLILCRSDCLCQDDVVWFRQHVADVYILDGKTYDICG